MEDTAEDTEEFSALEEAWELGEELLSGLLQPVMAAARTRARNREVIFFFIMFRSSSFLLRLKTGFQRVVISVSPPTLQIVPDGAYCRESARKECGLRLYPGPGSRLLPGQIICFFPGEIKGGQTCGDVLQQFSSALQKYGRVCIIEENFCKVTEMGSLRKPGRKFPEGVALCRKPVLWFPFIMWNSMWKNAQTRF